MSDSKPDWPNDVSRRDFLKYTAATGVVALAGPAGAQAAPTAESTGDLAALFASPPDSAKPWAIWHWMNGHVTREGITLDLEAMKRVGLGGFMNFDAGTGIPKGPVEYLSKEWFELKQHAIREAIRLGLQFGMHNCPGWSSSGGPWITPDLAMQQLTWSEEHVEGGARVEVALPKPFHKLDHYRDVAVLAYPSLRGEASLRTLLQAASSSGGPVAVSALDSSDPRAVIARPAAGGGPASLLLEFREPYQAAGVTAIAAAAGESAPGAPSEGFGRRSAIQLEASDDGTQFRPVARIGYEGGRDASVASAQFPPVTARYFRFSTPGPTSYSQVRFATVPRFADAGKRTNAEYNGRGLAPLSDPGTGVIDPERVIDLTASMDANGVLRWDAPAGRWTVLRFGHTPIGTLNRSAPDTGVGLECDKYRAEAIAFHFDKMMAPLLPLLKPLAGKGHMWLEVDSWEVGMQNWTPGFEREFQSRTGYGLGRYLPAMTGRVVGSAAATERVLWDLRRTQADLLADNYYGKLASLCHQHGIRLIVEPYDRGPMDEMQIGARGDMNLGEFWQGLSSIFQNNLTMRRTPKLAASIAHVNGQRIAGAEAFTGEPESARWQEHPFAMKTRGDENFTYGINLLTVHRYAHQPHATAAPGMTMGPWGIHFERTTTWWEPGREWVAYVSRCQALLQQGLFVADLAYFTGEDAGVYTKVQRDELSPLPPEGYDYDLVDAEVLLKRAKVEAGRLVLPDGMSYRVLVLQKPPTMTLPLMRRLHAMVRGGLVLVGDRPAATPSLRERAGEAEFTRLCDELWGPGGEAPVVRTVGSGRVFGGQPLSTVLDELRLGRDVAVSSESGDAPIRWIHRVAGETHLYFLANQRRSHERLVCTFRVGGRMPELWDAVTGAIAPAAVYATEGGRVRVGLELPPAGSVFVVFRSPAPAETRTAIAKDGVTVLQSQSFAVAEANRHAGTVNDFTVTLWAKPEYNVMLSTNNFMEGVKDPWTDQYAIYPPPGHDLHGAGHVTCGLAIGRNGVAVWERGTGKPVFALAAPARLSGWTHVALVYRAGVPSVYVGGTLVSKGEKKNGEVHPGVGPAHLADGASFFNGDMTEPVVHASALSDAEIAGLARSFPGRPMWDRVVEPAAGGLRVWENGSYRITTSRGRASSLVILDLAEPVVVPGPWRVAFPPGTGAPEAIDLPDLASFHLHATPGVRYFSGTATYRKEIRIPPALGKGRSLFLDLGQVEVIAEVVLNGTSIGILWARPYVIDITAVLRPGPNALEVKVTNLWPNRLIGDEQELDEDAYRPGAGGSGFASLSGGAIEGLPDWYREGRPKPRTSRVAFTTWKHYTKDSPLLESGLIGPVVLRSAGTVPLA
jgi:hypothetical protein